MGSRKIDVTIEYEGKLPNRPKVCGDVLITSEEYEDYLRLKREKSLWKDIIDIITCGTDARVMEFRLFKKSVRKYVNDKIYKNICDEYNKAVTEYRNKITQ